MDWKNTNHTLLAYWLHSIQPAVHYHKKHKYIMKCTQVHADVSIPALMQTVITTYWKQTQALQNKPVEEK